jgi:hypothetical protein
MRPTALALSAACFASVAAADSATAQEIRSPFEFVDERHAAGFFYGYAFADEGAVGLASEPGSLYGGRYLFRVGGPITLAAEVGYFPSTRTVFDLSDDEEEPVREVVGQGELNLLLVNAGIRFDVTGPRTYHGLMPYVLVMGGGAFDLADAPALEADIAAQNRFDFGSAFTGVFAIGTDYFIGPRLAILLEARQALWKVETPEPFVLADTDLPQEEWVGGPTLVVGAMLRF